MKFPSEVVRQTTVVVVDSQVSRTDLANTQFLLLVRTENHTLKNFKIRNDQNNLKNNKNKTMHFRINFFDLSDLRNIYVMLKVSSSVGNK